MTSIDTATPSFIRFGDVCDRLGMSRDSGYAHHRAGTFPIPTVMIGSILKCRAADVAAFIDGEVRPAVPARLEQSILARLINADELITVAALAAAGSTDPDALIAWAVDRGLLDELDDP